MLLTKTSLKKAIVDERYFRFIYIVSVFMSSFCFVERIFQILIGITMVWAAVLLVNRIKQYPTTTFPHYSKLLLSFLFITLFTAVVHYQDHLPTNMLMFYHACICFYLIYGMHTTPKQQLKKDMTLLFRTVFYLSGLFNIAGILVMLFTVRVKGSYTIGLSGNRFTGLYTHPNIAAFVSVIAIIIGHLLYTNKNIVTKKSLIPNWIFYCFSLLHVYCIFLSDSNGSNLFLILYIMFYTILKAYRKCNKAFRAYCITILKLLLLYGILMISMPLLRDKSQHVTSTIVNEINFPDADEDDERLVDIGRKKKADITTGRFDYLKKGLSLLSQFPIIGTGKGNIIPFGDQYLESGFGTFDVHNGYLTVLVATGIVGFSIFMLFLIKIALHILRSTFHSLANDASEDLLILTAALSAYAIYAFTERAILFDITFMVIILWVFLGYAVGFCTETKKPDVN